MKYILVSAFALLSNIAFAATGSLPTRVESIPVMDSPAMLLFVAMLMGFGIRYLRTHKQ